MSKLAQAIRDAAKKLLEEKKVDLVVGFAKGSLPLRSTPCFIRKPEEAAALTWDYTCENNLANYLRKREGKVAVVAKGCDARSIVTLIQENQINRDNLYVIGVPCSGMIDRFKVEEAVDGREVLEVEDKGDALVLKGKGFAREVKLSDLCHDTCKVCRHGNPVIYDMLAGEPVPAKPEDTFADVAAFEALSPAERRAALAAEFSRCIRCYACRNACPMCYCTECFVDCSTPVWIKKTPDVDDNIMFQAGRVFHSAGRCADCGACDRACPMGINLRGMTRKMVKEVKELFGHEAGVSLDEKPALSEFKADDPQPFLVKE
ncbi:MAG: 4Fe-4S dicluster domain-containing protein [Peptococcaceae bacterium]|nr:4Fe-4S dicluster domain-containing protein [Peptococcaceae bacterium]